MRILLCDNLTSHGAAHETALSALEACYSPEHQTERVLIPFSDEYRYSANQMMAMRLISVADRSDVMICLSAPSYLIPHPRKIIWLCGEPDAMVLTSKSPDWIVNALLRGLKEAAACYAADRKCHQSLQRLGIESEYLAVPKQRENMRSSEWISAAKLILRHVGKVKTK